VVSCSGFGVIGAHQRDGFESFSDPAAWRNGKHQRANATNAVVASKHECTDAAHTLGEHERADAAYTVGEHERANAANALEIR
jgi:hypothetical protein